MTKLFILFSFLLSLKSYAVILNTSSFKEMALREAHKLLGKTLEISEGPLLFRDGAWYNDLDNPKSCEDYSAFYLKIKIDPKLLPLDVDLAYELSLNSGKTHFVFIPRYINQEDIYVAFINQGIVEFKAEANEDKIKRLIGIISSAYPSASLKYYSDFKLLLYEASTFHESVDIRKKIESSYLLRFMSLNKIS